MIKERKYIIYIDGDNVQMAGINGIEQLQPEDEVYIFYNSASKAFNAEKKESISVRAKCNVIFQMIPATADAVDFAIAIEVCKRYAETRDDNNMYIMISKDNHFEAIIRELNRVFCLQKGFYRVTSIEEALSKYYLFKVGSKNSLRQYLVKTFGNTKDKAIFDSLSNIFLLLEEPLKPQSEIRLRDRIFFKVKHILKLNYLLKNRKKVLK